MLVVVERIQIVGMDPLLVARKAQQVAAGIVDVGDDFAVGQGELQQSTEAVADGCDGTLTLCF